MKDIVIVRPERCIGCGVCIRTCPAPDANITKLLDNGKLITAIDPDKCIACGECITNCKRGARNYVDDTAAFMADIENEEIILIADPTLKTAYPLLWRGILDWFKKKNCLILDGAFGADIYVWAFLRMLDSGKISNMISQPCTAVMNYIRIYHPSIMKNLAPIYSPALCSAIYIKKYLKRDNKIAIITPCTAKKAECMESGMIDYSITFKKMMDYFSRNDIYISRDQPENYDYPYMEVQGQLGVLLSRPEGLKDNILQRRPDMYIEAAQGVNRVYDELLEFEKLPEKKLPDVFDVLSCRHGCALGHGSGTNQSYFEIMTTMRELESEARMRTKSKGRFRTTEDKLFKTFDDSLNLDDFRFDYAPVEPEPDPNNEAVNKAFASMGKKTGVDRTYNCGSCGYSSCREMAVAIAKGLNVPEGCIEYVKKQIAPAEVSGDDYGSIVKECTKLSAQIEQDLGSVSGNMKGLTESSAKVVDKAKSINDLLKNIVAFCNKNATMDENSTKQMVKILETTIKSLTSLEENVAKTNADTHSVSTSVTEIEKLISAFKEVLDKGGTDK